VGKGNIVIHSRRNQRYKCRECGQTFTQTKGTPFYRLRHDQELVARVITLLAWGCPPQAIVVAFELDERTVADWHRRASALVPTSAGALSATTARPPRGSSR